MYVNTCVYEHSNAHPPLTHPIPFHSIPSPNPISSACDLDSLSAFMKTFLEEAEGKRVCRANGGRSGGKPGAARRRRAFVRS